MFYIFCFVCSLTTIKTTMTSSLQVLNNEIRDAFAKYAFREKAHKWIKVQAKPFAASVEDFNALVSFKANSKLSTISVAAATGKVTRTTYWDFFNDFESMCKLLQTHI